ncbi:fumarylacetoacetate hydrolase family protein [Bradyrhizobium sp. WSM3983]|uniref:fumarylacetoacetate hydrolase family protein n=1 Tax=Bradyrhizobium sp. WSM3983 TaxID=1038867 RepID=UPI0004182642|nr:fumarylacetoacetate hydrolase family protein [Bradyrhizobium sp. WSM3983]
MRFMMYRDEQTTGLAVQVDGGAFRSLSAGDAKFPGTLDEIVRRGPTAFRDASLALATGKLIDSSQLEFLPPFSRASKIICVGLNYADHSAESGMKTPDYPTVFARFNSSLVAHGQPLICPKVSTAFDYEGEMVAVIGQGGRNIPEEDALDHVAGYSVFNDGSVRDYQLRTPQWTIGKNFDGTGAFGPYFVTEDELPRGAKGLRLETRLNGHTMQNASTSDLIFDVARLVSLVSVSMTLEPGDLIVTGTPAGVGNARKPPVFMKPGDVCEIEIEKIGVLKNPVIAQPQ